MILSPHESWFAGPKILPEMISRRTGEPMVGVSFAAGATSLFADDAADIACSATEPLDAVTPIGSLAGRLAEQTTTDALDVLEVEMVNRLQTARVDNLVLTAERSIRSGTSAAASVALLGVDRRTFVPQFRRMVGVAPKHYERICRFNRAIEAIRRPHAASLASIAADHGFADQAHLTREVRCFGQLSPSAIHRDGSTMINHVAPDKIFKT